uniref:Reverse transcriptase domain-containing protein n=1 Tax=Populus alba TaxID=43335 RepID=A0A4U5P2M6_POPAL|nr:hypothetical protein D5086_0000234370 [Populus alba]
MKNKIDVCGLLETKMLLARVASMHKLRLKHWQYFSNADIAHTARIVVFWNPNTVHVALLASSAQTIHISITCLISQTNTMVRLSPLMKFLISMTVVLILAFGMLTILAVTTLGQTILFGAAHDQFLGVVSSCWASPMYGTSMYILCHKLKLLKGPLKELNRLHFSHISERVSRLESQLDQLQSAFQQDRDNSLLFEQDKLFRSKLSSLKFAENQFFRQKIKCKFLKDSDRGSKFFHALMGQNHRRNFIPAITCSNGRITNSLKEVGDVFVAYYQQLLGTSKSTIPLDSNIIQCGPCLPSHFQGSLLSPVSQDDIRQACISSASYLVAVNGDIHGFFSGHNGVRQGDPLSPCITLLPFCGKPSSRFGMLSLNKVGAQRWSVSP